MNFMAKMVAGALMFWAVVFGMLWAIDSCARGSAAAASHASRHSTEQPQVPYPQHPPVPQLPQQEQTLQVPPQQELPTCR